MRSPESEKHMMQKKWLYLTSAHLAPACQICEKTVQSEMLCPVAFNKNRNYRK
jgi:hypothetical protein